MLNAPGPECASLARVSSSRAMEAAARFVFASGGVVRAGELADFLHEHPETSTAFYEEVSPVRQLKRIVRAFGASHGLSWVDATPSGSSALVKHALTESQRETFPHTEIQLVPRCLEAVDDFLHANRSERVTVGQLGEFYTQFPLETAFMRRRCGGVLQFVRAYGTKRFATNDKELWRALDASGVLKEKRGKQQPLTEPESEPEPGLELELSPALQNKAVEVVVKEKEKEKEEQTRPRRKIVYVDYTTEEILAALRGTCEVLEQRHVNRSPFSPSVYVLLYEVFRMAHRSALSRKPAVDKPDRRVHLLTVEELQLAAPSRREPNALSDASSKSPAKRLLVPTPASGLTWTSVKNQNRS